MNYGRLALAALGAFGAYFAIGFLTFTWAPMVEEFRKYPAVYRNQEAMAGVMPAGMLAMLVAMLMMAALYAMTPAGGRGAAAGARFGALIGVFAVCAFVVHNYVNLNIGWTLTVYQAAAYFVEWMVCGLVIGLIYRPSTKEIS
jgi:hypothetical protein